MDPLLAGRSVLITGAARGQGRAHAVTSATEGADVVLFDLAADIPTVQYPLATRADMDETVRAVEALDRRAVTVFGDVRDQQSLDSAVQKGIAEFGKIDAVIANAGIWSMAPFWEMADEQWSAVLDTCVIGAWKTAKAVAPHMIERQTGSIVITSSVNGHRPSPGRAHYVAAKHGLLGLTRNIAAELAPFGVRCNSISPGAVDTPACDNEWSRGLMSGRGDCTDEEYYAAGSQYNPMKDVSFIAPQAIAHAALFLNSDLASTITGIDLPVDAGNLLV